MLTNADVFLGRVGCMTTPYQRKMSALLFNLL